MSWSRRAALILLPALLALPGCGFHPLHAKPEGAKSTTADLSQIKISVIADRTGQQVRNELLDLLSPKGEPEKPAYFLKVGLRESKQGLGVLKDETVSRSNYVLNANFSLANSAGRVLYSSVASSQASYNILDEHYASTASEQNARERTAKEVAQAIHLQISAYFSRAAAARKTEK